MPGKDYSPFLWNEQPNAAPLAVAEVAERLAATAGVIHSDRAAADVGLPVFRRARDGGPRHAWA